MASIIALDLLKSSLRLLNAIAVGETPTAAETQDGLTVLNDLLETWSTENLTVYTTDDQVFSLVPGQATYTLGPTGNWNGLRPIQIASAYTRYQGIDFPLAEVTDERYNLIPLKSQPGQIPVFFRFDADFPLASVTLWPVPNQATQITLTCNKQFTTGVTSASVIAYPPGYSRALRYALAVDIASEFQVPLPQLVSDIARESKAKIKRANIKPQIAISDPLLMTENSSTSLGQFLGGNF